MVEAYLEKFALLCIFKFIFGGRHKLANRIIPFKNANF